MIREYEAGLIIEWFESVCKSKVFKISILCYRPSLFGPCWVKLEKCVSLPHEDGT